MSGNMFASGTERIPNCKKKRTKCKDQDSDGALFAKGLNAKQTVCKKDPEQRAECNRRIATHA